MIASAGWNISRTTGRLPYLPHCYLPYTTTLRCARTHHIRAACQRPALGICRSHLARQPSLLMAGRNAVFGILYTSACPSFRHATYLSRLCTSFHRSISFWRGADDRLGITAPLPVRTRTTTALARTFLRRTYATAAAAKTAYRASLSRLSTQRRADLLPLLHGWRNAARYTQEYRRSHTPSAINLACDKALSFQEPSPLAARALAKTLPLHCLLPARLLH